MDTASFSYGLDYRFERNNRTYHIHYQNKHAYLIYSGRKIDQVKEETLLKKLYRVIIIKEHEIIQRFKYLQKSNVKSAQLGYHFNNKKIEELKNQKKILFTLRKEIYNSLQSTSQ